jgi:uncharacterized membrane protein
MNRWLLLSVAATVVALGAGLAVYQCRDQCLPPEVYTHWGIEDKPDGKPIARDDVLPVFLIVPGMMGLFVGLTAVLPWLSPKRFTVDEFRGTYNYVMALVVLMFGWMQAGILIGAVWPTIGVGRLLMGGVFLFFALLGNVLGKVRRNFWMGVRTPWTLASEPVWTQTHRLAAWLFTAAGVVGFVAVLIPAPFLVVLAVSLSVILAAALISVFYSLVLYKRLEKAGKLNGEAGEVTAPPPS